MTSASVNGVRIGYDDHRGDRAARGAADGTEGLPPVVLVHGHPFNRGMWAPQAAALAADGHRVVTADLRGYGESEVVPGVTPLEVFARDTAALMDHLGLDRAVLGGLSMGGQIVMDFCRIFPERVSGLLLADTFPAAETPEGKASRNATADRLLAEGMDGYADEVLDKMVAPYNVTALPQVAADVLRMMRTTPPEGAAAALRGRAERPDYSDLLTRVAVPALVVVGVDDAYTPVSDAEFMHERLPDSTLTVIQGAAHMPNLERPGEFNTALRAFLARVNGTGKG
ncbi:alpha/beta fold hydrolase [Streptomyces armeniacus]|uniref:Alpha/beta fold hydrolase n=1 Tax=Streptomyces armeniacus TaxID=83291 RepID=A0A345XR10_9ACTN|nr:alpha/beta fold hydrolase [Streptomyces armeniacus]AXK34076.1 alpha/beta fold hydrolase [Streptomyces armeniacus]